MVSASSRLTFELDSDYSTDISVDGQEEMPLLKGDLVRIERSSLVTNLVRLKQVSRLEKIKFLRSKQFLKSPAGWAWRSAAHGSIPPNTGGGRYVQDH